MIGCLVSTAATNYTILMLGRMAVGVGVGLGLALDPMYIAEVTPPDHRGALVTWSELALNGGIVGGFAMSGMVELVSSKDLQWRLLLSIGLIGPCLLLAMIVYGLLPESPRWLVAQEREGEAHRVLQRLFPDNCNIEQLLGELGEALAQEAEANEQSVGWNRLLCHAPPSLQRMLLVGVGLTVAQQLVGIDAIQNYLLDLMEESGIDEAKESRVLVLMGVIKLSFIFVGGKLFDIKGRRFLLLSSLAGMMLALLLISAAFLAKVRISTGLILFGIALYLAFFSIGMGPGAWLIASEVFPSSVRAKAMSVATVSNRLTATIMSSTFLSVAGSIGWGEFFLMLATICGTILVLVYRYLPETKGRSLEEMSALFIEITGDTFLLYEVARPRR